MPPWCWEAELWKMEIVAFRVRCMVRYRVWSGAYGCTHVALLLYLGYSRVATCYGIIPWRRTVGRHRFPQRRDTAPRTPIGQRL